MRIFYAIQATGNGHISRAKALYPELSKFGAVDFFLSGSNCTLDTDLPIKYRHPGCSLHYSQCGGLDYGKILKNLSVKKAISFARTLPLKKYDVIINDFDIITSIACKFHRVPSVHLGHQASFCSNKTPRPAKQNIIGELILKKYVQANLQVGFHFQPYDSNIFYPIIKPELQEGDSDDLGHVSVYLPSFEKHCLVNALESLPKIKFHWFLPEVTMAYQHKNIHYFPIDYHKFSDSLKHCHGIVTGAGFETPAEALYLKKKIISVPIQKHYEQQCNAEALKQLGVHVIEKIDPSTFANQILSWYNDSNYRYPHIEANQISHTLSWLFNNYPYQEQDTQNVLFI